MSPTFREFLKLYGPLAVGIVLATAWFLSTRNDDHLRLVGQRQETLVAQQARAVTDDVAIHASDAQFLAQLAGRLLDAAGEFPLRPLENMLTDFARSRDHYFMLRYIDADGQERVRVDRSFSGPVLRPTRFLQSKSDRYYFIDTMAAGKNDVYISRFDLNVEHGRVQEPYRPTIRFASPVVDRAGVKRGIMVLNFEGAGLLDTLERLVEGLGAKTMLLTGEGFWMLGLSPEDEWWHVLEGGDDVAMPNRFPEAWAAMLRADSGQIRTDQGLFTFDTVGVVPNAVYTDVPPTPEQAKTRWKIATHVDPDGLRVAWVNLAAGMAAGFMLLLAAGCWRLADYRVRQAEVEARLRESEERTLAISQSAQDAIVMVDDDDRVTYWNPAAERMFGRRTDEAAGQRLHDLIAPDDMPDHPDRSLLDFARSGKGSNGGAILEFEAVRKDGGRLPVEVAVSAFQLKGRWYAVGSIRDVARRKQDEMRLRRSEETSRALINAPTESAMLIDPRGTVVAINDIGAHRLGGSVDEIIGQNAFELISPDLAENRRATIARVQKTGEPARFEDFRADRHMLINVYPVTSPDGSVERLAIFARDVTEQRRAEAALRESEQRFRDVSEAVGEYIWETNAKGAFTFVTEDVVFVLGYTADELLGRTPFNLMPEDEAKDKLEWRENSFDRREPFSNVEIRNVTKEGRVIWLQISGVPYFDDGGEFRGYRGAAMNVTDRKAAENAVKASERKLRALAESAYDAIIMIDTNGRASFWNHAAEQLFGYTEEEALGENVHDLIAPPEARDKAELGMYQFAMTGGGPVVGHAQETVVMRKDGSRMAVERSVSGFRLGEEWYAVATIRDITQRKATEAKLRELATTDSLTGLYNRHRFMELSEREFARSQRYDRPLTMFMMDIDHFKKVNDTHGHDVGDQVLRALSEISVMALRNADVLGRLGGEEFGVLLPETGERAAFEVAERLRMSVERTAINTNAGELKITVSIGVATMQGDVKAIEHLLKRADVALYDAKQSGRNRAVAG